jgi:SAM-dependent methyltransferase
MVQFIFFCLYAVAGMWTLLAGAHCAGDGPLSFDANQQPLVGSYFDPQLESCGSEPLAEYTRLLHRIERSAGKWNDRHPRWRLLEALDGFDRYRQIVGEEINRFEALYSHVPQEQKQVRFEARWSRSQVYDNHAQILQRATGYEKTFNTTRALLDVNGAVTDEIVDHALTYYNISREELDDFAATNAKPGSAKNGKSLRTSVSQTLKHVVRDWATEGHSERNATMPYIIDVLRTELSEPLSSTRRTHGEDPHPRQSLRVLIPGQGLGRLAHEIAALGPHVEVHSNEFSAYMNIIYRWIVKRLSSGEQRHIHPFVENWSHARTRNEIQRSVSVPDEQALPESGTGKACLPVLFEGDFTSIFPATAYAGQYDVVVTLFFIDTARNLLSYLSTIRDLLRPGGIWINVGPLLWGSAPWVQLSLDEVRAVSQEMGFVFDVGRDHEAEAMYNFNGSSLYLNGYRAQYWTARKEVGDNFFDTRSSWWPWR